MLAPASWCVAVLVLVLALGNLLALHGYHIWYYSRGYAEDVTSVMSGASQGPHSFNSRSYAEDVTSVTSGASQGPHSFNLVFVCLCHAWRYPVSVPYRTVPSNTSGHIQLAAIFK